MFEVLTNYTKSTFMDVGQLFFFLIVIHSMQGWQSLRGMELQEKEAQQDYNSIQEIFLERTYS